MASWGFLPQRNETLGGAGGVADMFGRIQPIIVAMLGVTSPSSDAKSSNSSLTGIDIGFVPVYCGVPPGFPVFGSVLTATLGRSSSRSG